MTTAKKTTKKTTPAKPTPSEELAAEAAPKHKPEGSPDLAPFVGLSRRKKADYFRAVDRLMERQEQIATIADGDADTFAAGDAAGLYDLMADVEEVLRSVAVNADEYDLWASSTEDEDLMALMAWYMETFQPGEAKPSPN